MLGLFKGHDLFKIVELGLLMLHFQVSKAFEFRFFRVYGHDGHLGHAPLTININFRSKFKMKLRVILGFDWQKR